MFSIISFVFNVSVNEICKTAHISRSSFYTVFSSKKDIISYIMTAKEKDQSAVFRDFVNSKNDFERMWCLCNHYLLITEEFGPTLTGSLLSMEMDDPLGIYEGVYSINEWLIKLMHNCQEAGIIRCNASAELMVPIANSVVFQVIYDWCRCKGSFSLRDRARTYIETIFDVAPNYRWTFPQN